ncbi:MAG TPA: glycosyltransferase family 39 protein, partial [Candidatus Polarisedimenticolaceae bacterium]|nr:glycosyltransferase family 39 protein [Candidatus Polarisedimenticolaceae bacterium]
MRGSAVSRRVAVWLFAVGLALRLVHLLTVRDSALFNLLYIDPKLYDEWGLAIAGGRLLGEAPFFLDPLYPYVIGAIYAVTGRSLVAVAVVQVVLGACVAPLTYDAARRWFDPAVAGLAGAVAVVYPPSIYYSVVLLKPGIAIFLVALALWLLARALGDGRTPAWLATGFAFGLTVLMRTNLLLVVPLIALAVALERGAGGDSAGRGLAGWRAAVALAAGCLTALLPATVHNLAAGGEPILATTNWGQIFYIGNNEHNPTGRFEELPFVRSNPAFEQIDFKNEAERRAGRELSHGATSRFWFGEALDWTLAHPAAWAGLQWSKLRIYWGGYETPASLDYNLYSRHAPLLGLHLPGFGLLGPFGLLGAVLALGRPGWPRLLALWVGAGSLSVVAFFVLTRFRMVVVPALYVLAAAAVVELWRAYRRPADEHGWVRPLWLTTLLLVFFAFVNLPVRATADS